MDAMNSYISKGNTWIPLEKLRESISSLACLPELIMQDKIIYHKPLHKKDESCVTFPLLHKAENDIAKNLVRLVRTPVNDVEESYLNSLISKAEEKLGIILHETQRMGVLVGIRNPVFILTGGPGMGKTCVLQVIREVLLSLNANSKILFCAPTGKAARKITESTGCKAYTLNKKLGVTEENMNPHILENVDVVIIDEFSMCDVYIAAALFKAIKNGTKVIIVGDIDQLPSVGPGCVLKDLIASDIVPTVKLTKIFRQEGDSYIVLNSQKVKNGNSSLESNSDFKCYKSMNFKESAKMMEKLYIHYARKYGVENVACLTPYKNFGAASCNEMNKRLQNIFNPAKNGKYELKYYETVYRVGDIVMQLKNRAECVNGDVGKVIAVDERKETLTVKFCEGCVTYYKSQLKQLSLAYAMSIHKAQGSEYDAVVTCMNIEHGNMLSKNILYTVITRAKKDFALVGCPEAIQLAVNNETNNRYTLLTQKIVYEYEKACYLAA